MQPTLSGGTATSTMADRQVTTEPASSSAFDGVRSQGCGVSPVLCIRRPPRVLARRAHCALRPYINFRCCQGKPHTATLPNTVCGARTAVPSDHFISFNSTKQQLIDLRSKMLISRGRDSSPNTDRSAAAHTGCWTSAGAGAAEVALDIGRLHFSGARPPRALRYTSPCKSLDNAANGAKCEACVVHRARCQATCRAST